MKHFILLFTIFSLIQQQAYAAAFSCSISQGEADALALASGSQRLGLLSTSATILENPNAAKPVGDVANSQSVYMYSVTESLAAVGFTNNELANLNKNGKMASRCNSAEAIAQMKANGYIQLFAHSCTIYELVNRLVNLMTEADMLEQQNIEAKTALNQATAENVKREGEIKVEKKNVEEANKALTDALKAMDIAKKAHKSANDKLKSAQDALEALQKATAGCKEECESSANQLADAGKAVDEAAKEVAKTKKELETAVKKLVTVLIEKMGAETGAVLAILQGTVRGNAEGQDVQFKVVGKEFTLIDLGKTIGSLTGDPKEKATSFVEGDAGDKTTAFFTTMIKEYERTVTYADEIAKNEAKVKAENHGITPYGKGDMTEEVLKSNGMLGAFFTSYLNSNTPDAKTTEEILNTFASTESGADNIETLALAIKDYSADKKDKGVTNLEAMKTPQTRTDEITRQIDARKALANNLKPMIEKTICYLDQSLKLFKDFYKESSATTAVKEPFFVYVNAFVTDLLKQKSTEGYFSNVNYKGIQAEYACYAMGGNATSCKQTGLAAAAPVSNSCFWSGAVFGPSAPVKDLCDRTKVGTVTKNSSGNELTCKCQ